MRAWPQDNLAIIQEVVLPNEGGFVNNPADAGGPTNWGITMREYQAWKGRAVSVADIANMPQADAVSIYLVRYIKAPGFDGVQSLQLRTVLVDSAVLFGPRRPIQWLQTMLGVGVDGVMGSATLGAANASDARKLANGLACNRISFHVQRCVEDQSQLQFLKGWTDRAMEFIE